MLENAAPKVAEGHLSTKPRKTLELMNAYLVSSMARQYRQKLDEDFWGCVARASQPENLKVKTHVELRKNYKNLPSLLPYLYSLWTSEIS